MPAPQSMQFIVVLWFNEYFSTLSACFSTATRWHPYDVAIDSKRDSAAKSAS